MMAEAATQEAEEKESRCPCRGGLLLERKLKHFCSDCGQLCEACCDGGMY